MKILAAAIISLLLILPAAAQDKPGTTGGDNMSDKDVLEQCRAAALAKGLDEAARRQAVAACVIEASPKIASRIRCLMDAQLKNLDKEARLVAIKDCVEGKK